MVKVGVLISTSMNRRDYLINRSLNSVLNQTLTPNCIVIVDDNELHVFERNRTEIVGLGNSNLYYIQNQRTRKMSGTGAWNTGFDFLTKLLGKDAYVAILDDDDEWHKTQLESCVNELNNKSYKAVFSYLKRQDCVNTSIFTIDDLTIDNFLIGSPGIQGSNMFFLLSAILDINGFDENLHSCTDRDLMIRFIQYHGVSNIAIIPKLLVNHYTNHDTVTSNFLKKENGLDVFYRKYINLYSEEVLNISLARAEKFFKYKNATYIRNMHKPKIVIAIAMHNSEATIRRCLKSVLSQKGTKREVIVVIGNDASTDEWKKQIQDLLSNFGDRIKILELSNKDVVKTRNEINQYIVKELNNVVLIGRLDSDDEFASLNVLFEMEKIYDKFSPDLILAGNKLRVEDKIIDYVNRSTRKLLSIDYLNERLQGMAKGLKGTELPSCNLFITPNALKDYPKIKSAEDHALLVDYLIESDKYKWYFAEDLLAVIYSLSGQVTNDNKKSQVYLDCRKSIYQNFKELKSIK